MQILKEVRAARPLQRDEIAQTFVGIPVDWLLTFWSADRLPGKDENDRRWKLFFVVEKDDTSFVTLEVPIKGNEYLRGVDKGKMFKVKGVIKSIISDLSAIELDNVSFERVSR